MASACLAARRLRLPFLVLRRPCSRRLPCFGRDAAAFLRPPDPSISSSPRRGPCSVPRAAASSTPFPTSLWPRAPARRPHPHPDPCSPRPPLLVDADSSTTAIISSHFGPAGHSKGTTSTPSLCAHLRLNVAMLGPLPRSTSSSSTRNYPRPKTLQVRLWFSEHDHCVRGFAKYPFGSPSSATIVENHFRDVNHYFHDDHYETCTTTPHRLDPPRTTHFGEFR